MRLESGFGLFQICHKSKKWQWRDNFLTFFWRFGVFLVKFSDYYNFHVNIIPGSGVMTIFVHKRLTRNQEIWDMPVWVLPDIWRLGQVRDTKFGTNVSSKRLRIVNAVRVNNFYCFWVMKAKSIVRGGETPLHPD